jgi:hypothetical protein
LAELLSLPRKYNLHSMSIRREFELWRAQDGIAVCAAGRDGMQARQMLQADAHLEWCCFATSYADAMQQMYAHLDFGEYRVLDAQDAQPYSEIDAKPVALPLHEFKRVVHSIDLGAAEFLQADITPNFHSAQIRYDGKPLHVVASAFNAFGQHHWALCDALDRTRCELKFTDCDALAKRVRTQLGIRLLTQAELGQRVVSHPEVGDKDMRYWRPKTVGDALFNWWD